MFSLIDILNISAAWIGAITGVTGLFYSIFINRARLLITDAYAMKVQMKLLTNILLSLLTQVTTHTQSKVFNCSMMTERK